MTAGVYIHELASAGTMTANDCFVVDTGSAEVKLTFADLQSQIMQGNYTNVTDWDAFKPGTTREIIHGYSTGGTATGVPISGDNITYYGWVEGVTTYYTQHLYTMYTGTVANRNRYWMRTCVAGTLGNWYEVTKNWWNQATVTDLDATTGDGLYNFPATATGIPEGWGNTSGTVLVYGSSSTYVYQTAFRKSAASVPTVYHRSKSSSGWGNWYLLDATGKSVQNTEVRTTNIDLFPSYGVFGVWWVNLASSAGITGTKPYTTGQGVLMCLKQSADIVRQTFIPLAVASNLPMNRYYTISTDTWSDWADGTLMAKPNIKVATAPFAVSPSTDTSYMTWSTSNISGTIIGATIQEKATNVTVTGIVISEYSHNIRLEYHTSSGITTLQTVKLNVYYF